MRKKLRGGRRGQHLGEEIDVFDEKLNVSSGERGRQLKSLAVGGLLMKCSALCRDHAGCNGT